MRSKAKAPQNRKHIAFAFMALTLARGEPLDARQLAEEFSTTVRTCQRWIVEYSDHVEKLHPHWTGSQALQWRRSI